MESFFSGLLGVLVGKGFSQQEASSIIKALRDYLGFEPPVGLKGFVLRDLAEGEKKKSAVVVRGKTYDADALEALTKYDEVSVLAKSGDYLQVARTITHMADVETIGQILNIMNLVNIGNIENIESANIKTLDGKNIIIDLLKQTAYTERRTTISNNGVEINWAAPTGNIRSGKFFPRGMRGFIEKIECYFKNEATEDKKLTVYLSPSPTLGAIYSAEQFCDHGIGGGWGYATFEKMWHYDSLFIFVLSASSDLYLTYDLGTPYDAYVSYDGGVTWSAVKGRYRFRVTMKGETVGDLPISGTVNTIPVMDRGFSYKGIEEVSKDVPIGAGEVGYTALYECQVNELAEIVALFMETDVVPASPPAIQKGLSGWTPSGVSRPLTLGSGVNQYEYENVDNRVFAIRTKNVNQTILMELTANASSETTFTVKAILSKFAIINT